MKNTITAQRINKCIDFFNELASKNLINPQDVSNAAKSHGLGNKIFYIAIHLDFFINKGKGIYKARFTSLSPMHARQILTEYVKKNKEWNEAYLKNKKLKKAAAVKTESPEPKQIPLTYIEGDVTSMSDRQQVENLTSLYLEFKHHGVYDYFIETLKNKIVFLVDKNAPELGRTTKAELERLIAEKLPCLHPAINEDLTNNTITVFFKERIKTIYTNYQDTVKKEEPIKDNSASTELHQVAEKPFVNHKPIKKKLSILWGLVKLEY